LSPLDIEGKTLPVPNRLQVESSNKFDTAGAPRMKLQEAILVGNYQSQIKFSELTIDMYRLLQSLERVAAPPNGGPTKIPPPVPQQQHNDPTASGLDTKDNDEPPKMARRSNPHKYLLYRPTFAQLMLYLTTSFKDIAENSAMLLYISADGSKRAAKAESAIQEYSGGVATAVVNYNRKQEKVDSDQNALIHTLHPADLVPLTRKPFFLIVDSNNSTAFKVCPTYDRTSPRCLIDLSFVS
jgi:Protein SCAI